MFHAADRVLVGVLTTPEDFEIARDRGWYRIPTRHAPPSVADTAVLAFYFTAAFNDERWAIHWYAEVRGYELAKRRDLLPEQAEHPRAAEVYYKMQLGPLIHREPPIPSLRWRRITFLETTWDRFNMAEEINDLYISGADGLYVTLKESGFFPEREYLLCEDALTYTADLAIPCQEGVVAVVLNERPAPPHALRSSDLNTVQQAIAARGGPLGPQKRSQNT